MTKHKKDSCRQDADDIMKERANDNRNRIRDYFTRTVDYWHNLYDGRDFMSLHMADRKRIVLDCVDRYAKGKRQKILDLGCGTGILTKELLRKGHSAAGLDCSEPMLAKLEESLRGEPCEAFLGAFLGEATASPFPAESFDMVICVGVFQYQQNDEELVREISRILKQGGYCLFTLPNLLRLNYLLDPFYYCRLLARITGRILPKAFGLKRKTAPRTLSGDADSSLPCDKKYFIWQLSRSIRRHGLKIREIIGFGYGPLTFWRKQIISDPASVGISRKLDLAARTFSLLKLFANRWVFVVEKN